MKRSLGPKTLVYPTPVFVIGTYCKDGEPNVMTASWGGICCSQPPCVSIAVRKGTETYDNLIQRKSFTLGIASERQVREVDYFGLVSGRTADKLGAARFTAVKSHLVDAPYVKEVPLVLECRVVDVTELGMHTQFIGEILDAKADDEVIDMSGGIYLKKLKPLVFTPDTQEYFGIGNFVAKVFSAGKDV